MLITDITSYLTEIKEPSFRIKQMRLAIYEKYVKSFSDITTLSLPLRQQLEEKFGTINPLKLIHETKGEQAHKVLFETKHGHLIEAVKLTYLPNEERKEKHVALCISSQSGCPMGCKFCATGAIGFKQNLSADEIVGQYQFFKQQGDQIDSIIFMGMGEPLANPDNLFQAFTLLTSPDYFGLADHRLSLSTVGIVPGIERLIKEFPQINLTFSLHSPFDDQRTKLMPINETYPIATVFDSLDKYIETTKNRVFIAYTFLKDFNDSETHAEALSRLIKRNPKTAYLYHVNLIRYNPCPSEIPFERSDSKTIKRFQDILSELRVSNTLRQDFGTEIDAACGQLYATYAKRV